MSAITKQAPDNLVLVGRIESYLNGLRGVLPISCTSAMPLDNLFGVRSVTESWVFVSRALRGAAGVAVCLDNFVEFVGERAIQPNLRWRPYIAAEYPGIKEYNLPERFHQQPVVGEYVIAVSDSMQEHIDDGGIPIEEAWVELVRAAVTQQGEETAEIVVDLTRLRLANNANGHGLVASGPVSFIDTFYAVARFIKEGTIESLINVYSDLNRTLRRGGVYKNGAVVCHMSYTQPLIERFLTTTREDSAYARLGLCVDENFIDYYKENVELIDGVMLSGDMFMTKHEYDAKGERLLPNVCLEIRFKPHATCLLAHVPLSRVKHSDLRAAIVDGMDWLTDFHPNTGVESMGMYLKPSEDRQVGLGFLGLASHLAYYQCSYKEFADAFEWVLVGEGVKVYKARKIDRYKFVEGEPWEQALNDNGLQTSFALLDGVLEAAAIAKERGYDRAFTIAPTATCSYKQKDFFGFVATPEITPPIDRNIDRESEVFGVQNFRHNPDCEIAEEVGWETYYRVNCLFQSLFDHTGLGHAISTNWWPDQMEFGEEFLVDFLAGPLKSLYYAQPVRSKTQDKTNILQEACAACAE